MDKKYQIFISSTYIDLVDARGKVRDAILSMMHFPVGMEFFGAADEEQWKIIQDTIDSTDYYVLIVGQRYGTVIETGNDTGISYTEKEYRYAKEKGIPILAFILSDTAKIEKAFVETDPNKIQKLEEFKEEVKTGRLVDWWETSDELVQKVTIALHKQMDRKKRPGWVRSDNFDLETSHAEILRLNGLVRYLQEENTKLKSQIVTRIPVLTVRLSLDYPENNLVLELDENHMKIQLYSIDDEFTRICYEPLDRSCIDTYLDAYVSDKDLKEYNTALPSKKEVDEYFERLETYYRIQEGGVSLRLQISNTGTAKATDVRVSITFPNEIVVIEPEEVEKMNRPVGHTLPPNPIEKARKEFEERIRPPQYLKPITSADSDRKNFWEGIDLLDWSSPTPLYVDKELFIKKHAVFVNTQQILHKSFEIYTGTYLVPIKKGVFKATISLMCSEFLEEEKQYIDIEVV